MSRPHTTVAFAPIDAPLPTTVLTTAIVTPRPAPERDYIDRLLRRF